MGYPTFGDDIAAHDPPLKSDDLTEVIRRLAHLPISVWTAGKAAYSSLSFIRRLA